MLGVPTPAITMSQAQLQAFWDAVEADASLQKKLSASIDGEIDTPLEVSAVVAIAREAGFSITPADLLNSDPHALQVILELNDDDLEKVTSLLQIR
jgi:predicted ribosomally synthesized peptide with nif11-like leader